MKIFCISNSKDLAIGLKLTGIPSVVMKDDNKIIEKVDELKYKCYYETLYYCGLRSSEQEDYSGNI